MRMVARCVRGLESLLATEILRSELGTIGHLGHREVGFHTDHPAEATELRTADDVLRPIARIPDIGRAKPALSALAALAPPAEARTQRPVTGIEVTASFLGHRNFNRHDAEDAVGRALSERLGAPYHSRRNNSAPPPSYSGWRLIMDGDHATLLARVTGRPLHRRPYKTRTIPGTLHPPLAAAMAHMADVQPGHTVLDPCCGAGTLLIEAAHLTPGARFQGFDISPDAVRASRTNAAALATDLHLPIDLRRADAGRLPLPNASIDRVLCNPPWGTQAGRQGDITNWWKELRRVLTPEGAAVVLTPQTADLTTAIQNGLSPVQLQQVRISGMHSSLIRLQVQ